MTTDRIEQQSRLMKIDPATGDDAYPTHAGQWRKYHGNTAWLWNPWTGKRRDADDVGSDPQGLLIIPEGEPLLAELKQQEWPEKTKTEKQSNYDRLQFAESLIKQLPEDHDGRNTWLLNYGPKEKGEG